MAVEEGDTEGFEDDCSDFDDWIAGDDWSISGGAFRGHHDSWHDESDRYLTLKNSLNFSIGRFDFS